MSAVSREMLPLVDENDNVVGEAERGQVHQEGLRHRAVHLLVFNDDGWLFLQRRSWDKECNPGAWDSSVSGHVDSGESYDECVIREAREEIGLALDAVPEKLFKLPPSGKTGNEFCWVYRTCHPGPFVTDPVEIIDSRWVKMQDLQMMRSNASSGLSSTLCLILERLDESGTE